jgi:hypothetical protein
MENTAYLRRQAVFCLRLSELCPDAPTAAHLAFMAAQFHERALRAEFAADFDLDRRDLALSDPWLGNNSRH